MAFYVGSTKVIESIADGNAGVYKIPTSTVEIGSPVYSDGTNTYFAYPGSTNNTVGSGYLLRSIYTHGFTCGGYKNSTPWRNVNKTWHATKITYNCGDQMEAPMAYGDGMYSDVNGYIFGVGGQGSYANTNSINLHTGISRSRRSGLSNGGIPGTYGSPGQPYGYEGHNPLSDGIPYGQPGASNPSGDLYTQSGTGGWMMSVERDSCGASTNILGQNGYVTGGGSSVTNKLHFPTEIMYTTTDCGTAAGHTSGGDGENRGIFSLGGTKKYITYSNDVWSTFTGGTHSTDGINKYLDSKYNYWWCGNGSNSATTTVSKIAESTMTEINTSVNRGFDQGEENSHGGQSEGYTIGAYDGSQNNASYYLTYSNDTFTVGGPALRPKGHYGLSSAAGLSAAASITSAYAVN